MASKALRPIRIEGNEAFITLTKGYVAVIDAADVPLVSGVNWYAIEGRRPDGSLYTVYAVYGETTPGVGQRQVRLHRLLVGASGKTQVDHEDGDGLNCRRSNLRIATHSQNMHNRRLNLNNSSGDKGVTRHKASGKWVAQIGIDGERRHLGLFTEKADAAEAYRKAAISLHGEFARLR